MGERRVTKALYKGAQSLLPSPFNELLTKSIAAAAALLSLFCHGVIITAGAGLNYVARPFEEMGAFLPHTRDLRDKKEAHTFETGDSVSSLANSICMYVHIGSHVNAKQSSMYLISYSVFGKIHLSHGTTGTLPRRFSVPWMIK